MVFSVAANRMASRVASSAIETIRGDLFEKVSRLSNTEIDRFTRPSLISRLTSDTYNVHQMLGRVQRLGVRAPILLIGGITMTMALEIVSDQLAEVGIRAEIKNYDESTWLETRKSGELGSFMSTWSADYNDPDNFIYTFFGNE